MFYAFIYPKHPCLEDTSVELNKQTEPKQLSFKQYYFHVFLRKSGGKNICELNHCYSILKVRLIQKIKKNIFLVKMNIP